MFVMFNLLIIWCAVVFACLITFWVFNYVVSIFFLGFNSCFWDLNLDLNIYTLLVLLMLLICFSYVYFYTHHYFDGSVEGVELNKIICLFVGVMASLVMTGDYLSTLILWEYLGVVSFFLILFYDSYLSLRSSIITLVSSRFGDVCLFVLIALSCYVYNSIIPATILFFLIIFTKSASFPFISWLLEAMRAPTPVSSLVHSSTLVAAGVWFFMRYDYLLYSSNIFIFSLLLISTIIITGLCCFYFIDLKKIVALSTCNNIAWCVFYLIFGDYVLSILQLISHGVSKCMLFMLVGDVMSGSSGSQASNCVFSPYLYGNWSVFGLFCVILGLSGAPFIGVFFSKHFLLINFMNVESILLYTVILFCVFLSYFYSFRLCSVLINVKSSISFGVLYFFNSSLMVIFWLVVNYLITLNLDENTSLNSFSSAWLIIFQLLSLFTAYFLYNSVMLSCWSSSLFGCDNIVELFYVLNSRVVNFSSIFIYRWDNFCLSLCNYIGSSSIHTFSNNLLNILFLLVILTSISWFLI
uniref:NADH:ubiquinone reductase (H(+)-translocating) n=1 Tax=Cloacotaenia megalops TaxID=576527 RepID=A0A1L2FZE1_9CEST|nr:NADH dehydrogenase subunit 5 [Cloacotaenia megalops]AOG66044.1 NADH dehydrogenase subunit 5 [Cloacotaenia megalops]